MTKDKIYSLYSITCLVNGKKYIGVTTCLYKRKYEHFIRLSRNTHKNIYLQDDYNQYGRENFVLALIEEFTSKEQAYDKERWYTNTVYLLNKDVCYNILPGGEIGTRKGVKIPEEKRQNYCQKTGEKNPASIKVINTETGEIYSCIKEAAKKNNISDFAIRRMLNGKRKNITKLSKLMSE